MSRIAEFQADVASIKLLLCDRWNDDEEYESALRSSLAVLSKWKGSLWGSSARVRGQSSLLMHAVEQGATWIPCDVVDLMHCCDKVRMSVGAELERLQNEDAARTLCDMTVRRR